MTDQPNMRDEALERSAPRVWSTAFELSSCRCVSVPPIPVAAARAQSTVASLATNALRIEIGGPRVSRRSRTLVIPTAGRKHSGRYRVGLAHG